MFRKVLIVLVLILLVAGCGSDVGKGSENVGTGAKAEEEKNETLLIKTHVTNKEEKGGYLIYFMYVGSRREDGISTTRALGPFVTDENGECLIDLEVRYDEYDFGFYFETDPSPKPVKNKLELFVVTPEDTRILNPLNEQTIVEFVPNNTSESWPDYEYYAKEKEIDVTFTDKYPDGVLSLDSPDAIFVIKLEFEGEPPENSFEVSVHWDNPERPNDIGIFRVGRICRSSQYWDTPFFEGEMLPNMSGKIVVNHFETDEIIKYEGYPMSVSFDANGRHKGDPVVKIKMPK